MFYLCFLFCYIVFLLLSFFFSSRRRHTRCALVTGVQTCALPIWVKTIAQSGVPGYRKTWWYGLLAPKNTDDQAVDRVSQAVSVALHSPEVRERFAALGIQPLNMTRKAFASMVAHDRQAWKEQIGRAHV